MSLAGEAVAPEDEFLVLFGEGLESRDAPIEIDERGKEKGEDDC